LGGPCWPTGLKTKGGVGQVFHKPIIKGQKSSPFVGGGGVGETGRGKRGRGGREGLHNEAKREEKRKVRGKKLIKPSREAKARRGEKKANKNE